MASPLLCQCNRLSKRYSYVYVSAASTISRHLSSSSSQSETPPKVSLTFQDDRSVAILRLCNPKRKNALTVSMMDDLDQHVETLAKWSTSSATNDSDSNNSRVVILTGMGDTFCSGLDLHDNGQDSSERSEDSARNSLRDGNNMVRHMTRVTNRLLSLPVLSIAAVDGYAVGGGAELSTCTDLVVLSRSADIRFVHCKRGAAPGWGGGRRLVKKIGRRKALGMLLLGDCVTGKEEARTGCVYSDAVAEEGESALDATMRLIVKPILELPCAQSIRAIKMSVSAADGDREVIDPASGTLKNSDMSVDGEMEAFMSVWGGDSNREQIQQAKDRLKAKNKIT